MWHISNHISRDSPSNVFLSVFNPINSLIVICKTPKLMRSPYAGPYGKIGKTWDQTICELLESFWKSRDGPLGQEGGGRDAGERASLNFSLSALPGLGQMCLFVEGGTHLPCKCCHYQIFPNIWEKVRAEKSRQKALVLRKHPPLPWSGERAPPEQMFGAASNVPQILYINWYVFFQWDSQKSCIKRCYHVVITPEEHLLNSSSTVRQPAE